MEVRRLRVARLDAAGMKQVVLDRYGQPEEVVRCAEVPDVRAPARAKSCSTSSRSRSIRPTSRSARAVIA